MVPDIVEAMMKLRTTWASKMPLLFIVGSV